MISPRLPITGARMYAVAGSKPVAQITAATPDRRKRSSRGASGIERIGYGSSAGSASGGGASAPEHAMWASILERTAADTSSA
jgi:hypothetical protein